MPLLCIPAHYDGKHVKLDEDVRLKPDTKLLVTVLEPGEPDREAFLRFSQNSLSRAYEEDEVEYTMADLEA
jgi:hypothetical protein